MDEKTRKLNLRLSYLINFPYYYYYDINNRLASIRLSSILMVISYLYLLPSKVPSYLRII